MKDKSLLEGNENYWKQRCEAAERVYTTHLRDSNSEAADNAFAEWMDYFKTPPPPPSILPEGDGLTDIETKAREWANSKGHQSDKEQFTTTPWTEWNIRFESFIAGSIWNAKPEK